MFSVKMSFSPAVRDALFSADIEEDGKELLAENLDLPTNWINSNDGCKNYCEVLERTAKVGNEIKT